MPRLRQSAPYLVLLYLALVYVGCFATGRATGGPTLASGANGADRPNILLILADDLDLQLGSLDYMPNLQRLLTEQGTTFTDFFITNSLCCPSRATILRGQYTHSHQTYTNQPPYGGYDAFVTRGLEASTVATWLHSGGYTTALMGKYMNGYPLVGNEQHIPAGWTEWYSPAGGNPYSSYNYQMNENGTLVNYGRQSQDYITDVLSDKANDFIRRAAQTPTPFFLYLAPYAPHSPANPAPRHETLFATLQAPRTPSFNEADVRDKPRRVRQNALLTTAEIQALDDLYRKRVQSLQAIDEMIARLVTTLEDTGRLDHTYIIFTSDNGYHMGQHRLPDGKALAYEEDIRVPFIIRGPGIAPGTRLSGYLSGNVDLAPTLADLGGVTPPDFVEGRSLLPLLAETPPAPHEWRQAYLVEQYPLAQTTTSNAPSQSTQRGLLEPPDGWTLPGSTNAIAQTTPTAIYKALRLATITYVEWNTGEREVYNLLTDPYQLENQATSASATLLAHLSTWLSTLHTCQGALCRVLESQSPFALTTTPSPTASPPPTAALTPTRTVTPLLTATPSPRLLDITLFLPMVER